MNQTNLTVTWSNHSVSWANVTVPWYNVTVIVPTALQFLNTYETTSYIVYGSAAGLSSCMVMYVLYGNKKLWKKFSLFFWLASSNLSSCIGIVSVGVVDFYQTFHAYLDVVERTQCYARLYPFMITISRQTSSTIGVFICLERVIAIGLPFRYNLYCTKIGKKFLYCFLFATIATSAIVATASSWFLETEPLWACYPPSVFHPTFIKFQRLYPIFCDCLCALLTLTTLHLHLRRKRKTESTNQNSSVSGDHMDPVINRLVGLVVLLNMVFGFVPDTIYLVWAPIHQESSSLTPFTVFSIFYQVLPSVNICTMLLLHCWLVKDFRRALLGRTSSVTEVKNAKPTTHF